MPSPCDVRAKLRCSTSIDAADGGRAVALRIGDAVHVHEVRAGKALVSTDGVSGWAPLVTADYQPTLDFGSASPRVETVDIEVQEAPFRIDLSPTSVITQSSDDFAERVLQVLVRVESADPHRDGPVHEAALALRRIPGLRFSLTVAEADAADEAIVLLAAQRAAEVRVPAMPLLDPAHQPEQHGRLQQLLAGSLSLAAADAGEFADNVAVQALLCRDLCPEETADVCCKTGYGDEVMLDARFMAACAALRAELLSSEVRVTAHSCGATFRATAEFWQHLAAYEHAQPGEPCVRVTSDAGGADGPREHHFTAAAWQALVDSWEDSRGCGLEARRAKLGLWTLHGRTLCRQAADLCSMSPRGGRLSVGDALRILPECPHPIAAELPANALGVVMELNQAMSLARVKFPGLGSFWVGWSQYPGFVQHRGAARVVTATSTVDGGRVTTEVALLSDTVAGAAEEVADALYARYVSDQAAACVRHEPDVKFSQLLVQDGDRGWVVPDEVPATGQFVSMSASLHGAQLLRVGNRIELRETRPTDAPVLRVGCRGTVCGCHPNGDVSVRFDDVDGEQLVQRESLKRYDIEVGAALELVVGSPLPSIRGIYKLCPGVVTDPGQFRVWTRPPDESGTVGEGTVSHTYRLGTSEGGDWVVHDAKSGTLDRHRTLARSPSTQEAWQRGTFVRATCTDPRVHDRLEAREPVRSAEGELIEVGARGTVVSVAEQGIAISFDAFEQPQTIPPLQRLCMELVHRDPHLFWEPVVPSEVLSPCMHSSPTDRRHWAPPSRPEVTSVSPPRGLSRSPSECWQTRDVAKVVSPTGRAKRLKLPALQSTGPQPKPGPGLPPSDTSTLVDEAAVKAAAYSEYAQWQDAHIRELENRVGHAASLAPHVAGLRRAVAGCWRAVEKAAGGGVHAGRDVPAYQPRDLHGYVRSIRPDGSPEYFRGCLTVDGGVVRLLCQTVVNGGLDKEWASFPELEYFGRVADDSSPLLASGRGLLCGDRVSRFLFVVEQEVELRDWEQWVPRRHRSCRTAPFSAMDVDRLL